MSFNVRIFGHSGLTQIPLINPKQFSADSVMQLSQPYLWAQTLVAGGVAVSSSAQASPDQTQAVVIEVPDNAAIRYEINPPNRPGGVVAAYSGSPILQGRNVMYFQPGWTISIIDAAALP